MTRRMNMTQSIAAAGLLALFGAPAFAQIIPDTPTTEADGVLLGGALLDNFGKALAVVPDLDGDGLDDIAVGIPGDNGAGGNAGAVTVYSGKTGAVILDILGPSQKTEFGNAIAAAGDVDGDGVGDLFIGGWKWDLPGAPGGDNDDRGAVFMHSGATGEELWRFFEDPPQFGAFQIGRTVGAIGDMDGDGVGDVVSGSSGVVHILSGASGALIDDPLFPAFVAVGDVGDVDGDGVTDFAVGSCRSDIAGMNSGEVNVLSGADGSLIHAQLTDPHTIAIGTAFAGADVNGDGFSDIIAGAKFDPFPGNNSGRVVVFDGATGAVLYGFDGEADGDEFGIDVDGAGDVDGDGCDDFLVGAWRHDFDSPSNGRAYLYSGKSGTLIHTYTGVEATQTHALGRAVGAGDFNGDGTPDFVFGAMGDQTIEFGAGAAYVFMNCVADLTDDGAINGGDVATLLSAWGDGEDFGADLNGDGVVNGADLANLLAAWGPCGFGVIPPSSNNAERIP